MVSPANYGEWSQAINITGVGLDLLAQIIRISADVQDQSAFDLADQISSVAEWFLQFETVWCLTVADPSPYPVARCYEHDGIVPAWSQAYDAPRLPYIIRLNGPIHTGETSDSDDQLYEAEAFRRSARADLRSPSATARSSRREASLAPSPRTSRESRCRLRRRPLSRSRA